MSDVYLTLAKSGESRRVGKQEKSPIREVSALPKLEHCPKSCTAMCKFGVAKMCLSLYFSHSRTF